MNHRSLSLLLVALTGLSVFAQEPATEKEKKAREAAFARGEISFDDLKFDIEKGDPFKRELLTERIESLNDRTVQLRGFILPSTLFRDKGFNEFVLVRDNLECCFGPGAALYDCVIVNLVNGVTADFTTRPVTVKGKFHVKEYLYPDGSAHFAIYQIEGVSVK